MFYVTSIILVATDFSYDGNPSEFVVMKDGEGVAKIERFGVSQWIAVDASGNELGKQSANVWDCVAAAVKTLEEI